MNHQNRARSDNQANTPIGLAGVSPSGRPPSRGKLLPPLPKDFIVLSKDTVPATTTKIDPRRRPQPFKMFRSNAKPKISSPKNPMMKERSLPLFPKISNGTSPVPRSTSDMNMGNEYVSIYHDETDVHLEDANITPDAENRSTRAMLSKHLHQIPGKRVLKRMKDALSNRFAQVWLTTEKANNDSDRILAQALRESPKLHKFFPDKQNPSKYGRLTYNSRTDPLLKENEPPVTQSFADHGYVSSDNDEIVDKPSTQLRTPQNCKSIHTRSSEENARKADKEKLDRHKSVFGMALSNDKYPDFNPDKDSHPNVLEYFSQSNMYPTVRPVSQVSLPDETLKIKPPGMRRLSTPTLPNRQEGIQKAQPNQPITSSASQDPSYDTENDRYALEISGLRQHTNPMEFTDCPYEDLALALKEEMYQVYCDSASLAELIRARGLAEAIRRENQHSNLNHKRSGILVKKSSFKKILPSEFEYNPRMATAIDSTLPGLYSYGNTSEMMSPRPSLDMKSIYPSIASTKRIFSEARSSSQACLPLKKYKARPLQKNLAKFGSTNSLQMNDPGREFHSQLEVHNQIDNAQRQSHETSLYSHTEIHPLYKCKKENRGSKISLNSIKSSKSLSNLRATFAEKVRKPRYPRRTSLPISRPLELGNPVNFSKPFRQDATGNINDHASRRTAQHGLKKAQTSVKKGSRIPRIAHKETIPNMRHEFTQGSH